MANRLPNIFKNNDLVRTCNNRNSFYSFRDAVSSSIIESMDRGNKDRIEELFNVPVEIVTKEGSNRCRIISKIKNHILTSNNEKVLLDDIIEIKKSRPL